MLRFAATGDAIAATTSTLEKSRLLAEYLATLDDADLRRAATWFSGQPYGRAERKTLNLGWATVSKVIDALSPLDGAALSALFMKHSDLGDWAGEALVGATAGRDLSMAEIAAGFDAIREAKGAEAKRERLHDLLAGLDPRAGRYVVKVLSGEMRIGLQEGIAEAAIARAFDVPSEAVRRVHMLTGDIGETALRVRNHRLDDTRIEVFQPIRFMLASPVETPDEAMERAGIDQGARGTSPDKKDAGVPAERSSQGARGTSPDKKDAGVPAERSSVGLWTEEKYDGVRCQLHRAGARCELFSRDLKETSLAFPEIVEAGLALPHDVVLDGEILAHRGDRVLPFFDLQRRLGRKVVGERLRREVPLVFVAFDLLALDGEVLLDRPLRERRARLEKLGLQPPFLLARVESAGSAADLERIFAETRERGNEGLMLKNPASPYTPGRRGMAWLKLKRPLATLDCVVTAVEWGHGKRRGVLSDYTFAVRDEDQGGRLVNVGKAYSGLTDVEIATMTRHFLDHTVNDLGRVRLVEPDTVVEIAFDSIQRSTRHRSGFALRFPRIVRLRDDKPPAEADTLTRVRELYDRYFGQTVPLAEVAETSSE